MTTIELWNLALMKLGVTKGVTALDEASLEAFVGEAVYDHALRYSLRRFPFPFATKYAANVEEVRHPLLLAVGPLWNTDPTELTRVQAWSSTATYEPGDVVRESSVNYTCIATSQNNTPPNDSYWSTDEDDYPEFANGDWLYGYRWPSDCLFARRLVPAGGEGRQFSPDPIRFRIGRDVNGLLIYTHEQEAVLEYTVIDCDALWADDLFIDAFTWKLAELVAAGIARNGLTQRECMALFERALNVAATVAMNEGQQDPHGDPDWIVNR